MDKQNMVSLQEIIWQQKENKYCAQDMNEPWKHYAKLKKPDTVGHRLYDSIYRKVWNREIQKQKVDYWLSGVTEEGGRGRKGNECSWVWDFFWGQWNVLKLDIGDGDTTPWI